MKGEQKATPRYKCARCRKITRHFVCKVCQRILHLRIRQYLAFLHSFKYDIRPWIDGVVAPPAGYVDNRKKDTNTEKPQKQPEVETPQTKKKFVIRTEVSLSSRECDDCGELIPQKRVDMFPGVKFCAACQESHGDVFVYRGVGEVVGGQHCGGIVEVIAKSSRDWSKVSDDVVENDDQIKDVV